MEWNGIYIYIIFIFVHICSFSEKPMPTLTIEPSDVVFIGETLTLKCDIEHQNDWTYKWHLKHLGYRFQDRDFNIWQGFLSKFTGNTLTIKEVSKFHQTTYSCEVRSNASSMTSYSSYPFPLTVKCELILTTFSTTVN